MRPLLVDLGRDFRGGQHQALLLLKGLLSHGHSPVLIAVRDSVLAHRAMDAGISIRGVAPGCRRLAAALQIRQLVHGGKVDLVHANEPHALSAAWLARAHRKVPVIAARRVIFPLSSSSISLARYRAATFVVAVSKFAAQSVISSGFPPDRIQVIYDGVEILGEISSAERRKARADFKIPEETLCVGYVAAFTSEKGHSLLINALAELRNPLRSMPPGETLHSQRARPSDCCLLLRGEGPEIPAIQELARQLHMEDKVRFVPPTTDVEKVFAATDIFAFPSRGDALGTALLAAMARGLPSVAIARGGVPEVIEDGKNGFLVDSLDPKEFSISLSSLAANPKEAARIGHAARERIISCFSVDHMVDTTIALYERTAGGSMKK